MSVCTTGFESLLREAGVDEQMWTPQGLLRNLGIFKSQGQEGRCHSKKARESPH